MTNLINILANQPKHEWLQLPLILGASLVFVLMTWLMWGKDWDDRD
jgi:formate hydrogenlyase subunit 4